jgi:hypothetical protein
MKMGFERHIKSTHGGKRASAPLDSQNASWAVSEDLREHEGEPT